MHKLTSISFNGVTVNDWATASKVAAVFDTVAFKVVWANGETYEGTAQPTKAGYDFAKHIRHFALTYTGKAKPAHLTEEQYRAGLKQAPKDMVASLNRILKDCDLTETESPKDDPAPGNVVDIRAWRFSNIQPTNLPPQVVRDEGVDSFADDFFPEPEKDLDNFVAKDYNTAAVYQFTPPKGRM